MPDQARALVRRYFVYAGLYTLAASIIWGVNTLFLLDAGLSIAEVFIANSAYSAGMMVFEIPTGVVADTLGRRVSFLLSIGVLMVSTLAYVGLAQIDAGLLAFAGVSVFMGLGFTFYSGAMEAWLVDGVRFHGYAGDMDRIFGRGQIVSGASMLVGTVGGGVLGQIDLAIPFLVRAGLFVLLLVLAVRGMHDLGFTPHRVPLRDVPAETSRVARAGVRFGWSHRSLRLLMVATAIQLGFFSWAWYAWQPYLLELYGRDAVWLAGVVAAVLAISMMVGNAIVEVVMRWCGRRTTLFIAAGGVLTLASMGVGIANSVLAAVAALFVAGVALGVQGPVRQSFIHHIVPSEHRATVVSLDSMVSGGGGVAGQSALGAVSQERGFSLGYIAGGAFTVLALPFLFAIRRRGDEADRYVGTATPACPTAGAPGIAAVDQRVTADV